MATKAKPTTQSGDMQLKSNYNSNDFYEPNARITYIHLEKGLLLFVYLHETSSILKTNARIYKKLWTGQICYHSIVPNNFHDPYFCSFDHSEAYEQSNLCRDWYMRNCTQKSCKNQHYFIPTKAKRYINNETDLTVWNLMRFIRQFFRHFKQSVIDEEDLPVLHREIGLIMISIVNYVCQDTNKSAMFLSNSLINQTNKKLLKQLSQKSTYSVPEIFLTPENIKFSSKWYTKSAGRISIDFEHLSQEFVDYLSDQLEKYCSERLEN
ncbi:unnamed protein product [Adineta ricciae]|uniref:C3H1-type domain-containing protein n=1 Tax=Adineta ricciae TaxID=249248 RepID=A0A814PN08_ADIRI|nr:unnamed protein product [Adineta ricciae]CAF1158699.1 unnamed protein product [Adineta ricciae]